MCINILHLKKEIQKPKTDEKMLRKIKIKKKKKTDEEKNVWKKKKKKNKTQNR